MTAEERIAPLEMEVAKERAKTARVEAELAAERAENTFPAPADGAQPPPSSAVVPKRRGRQKQSAAKNLLDDFLRRADRVLAFLVDLSLPFTNNQAEQDLRMVKVQQKIARTFRSEAGATAFCHIRSYLSTMRKQDHAMLAALSVVFADKPLPVAWAPG